jgi:hypothetical protein
MHYLPMYVCVCRKGKNTLVDRHTDVAPLADGENIPDETNSKTHQLKNKRAP